MLPAAVQTRAAAADAIGGTVKDRVGLALLRFKTIGKQHLRLQRLEHLRRVVQRMCNVLLCRCGKLQPRKLRPCKKQTRTFAQRYGQNRTQPASAEHGRRARERQSHARTQRVVPHPSDAPDDRRQHQRRSGPTRASADHQGHAEGRDRRNLRCTQGQRRPRRKPHVDWKRHPAQSA